MNSGGVIFHSASSSRAKSFEAGISFLPVSMLQTCDRPTPILCPSSACDQPICVRTALTISAVLMNRANQADLSFSWIACHHQPDALWFRPRRASDEWRLWCSCNALPECRPLRDDLLRIASEVPAP